MDVQDFISAAALIVSITAAAIVTRQTRKNSNLDRLPILIITWNGTKQLWSIRNVGRGPALNVIVAQRTEDDKNLWYNPVSVPAVPVGESFDLEWLGSGPAFFSLGARYSDFLDKAGESLHFTYTRHDRCSVYPPGHSPDWIMPTYSVEAMRRYWEHDLPREIGKELGGNQTDSK
jgi:hypothetical protein